MADKWIEGRLDCKSERFSSEGVDPLIEERGEDKVAEDKWIDSTAAEDDLRSDSDCVK